MDHIDKMDVGVWDTGYQVKKSGMKPDEVIICQNRCSSVKPHRLCTGPGCGPCGPPPLHMPGCCAWGPGCPGGPGAKVVKRKSLSFTRGLRILKEAR